MENYELKKVEYGLPEKFDHSEIYKYHEFIEQSYLENFSDNNYAIHDAENLIAGKVDTSVLFIGSTISALKPLYINDKIPSEGIVINQPCIRTRNLENAYTDKPNKGNTFFNLIGGLAPGDKFSEVYQLSLKYFYDSLKIDPNRIFIRASSEDQDILERLKIIKNQSEIELDKREPTYYRWKYGIEGVSGRGIALVIRNSLNPETVMTLGNIIIMEGKNHQPAIQWGYGVETLVSGIYNKKRAIEGSLISQVVPYETGPKSKFADAFAAVIEMYNSGLSPSNRGAESYLKAYLRALAYLKNASNIGDDEFKKYILKYCQLRNINNTDSISINIEKEINKHDLNVDRLVKALKEKSASEIKQLINSKNEVSKLSNKYKIHPKEIINIIKTI